MALKLFNPLHEEAEKSAKKEFKILSLVQGHPNFVKILDFRKDVGKVNVPNNLPESPDDVCAPYRYGTKSFTDATCMSMELSEFGDLFDIVKSSGGFKSIPLVRHLFA